MLHQLERDWKIVAPWWKWGDPRDPRKGRLTRPVLQKYDTSDLVNEFIKAPQHCLKFVKEDLVHTVQPASPVSRDAKNRRRRFIDLQYVPDGTNTRKIFRDIHKRFYLVVCQFHCDAPGFPRVDRKKICEAGFVVRRRAADIPSVAVPEGRHIVTRLSSARGRLATLDAVTEAPETMLLAAARSSAIVKLRPSIVALIDEERARFEDWVKLFGIAPQLQGWFRPKNAPSKTGEWRQVEGQPDAIGDEVTYLLTPLIADGSDANHAGNFGTIYFGLLPSGSDETDDHGRACFDEQQYYEVQCFVRRHLEPHDPGSPCRCPDHLFWSPPTERFRLAAHFDGDGSAHRPVTIQLPDIDALGAQAKPGFGVAFAKPKGSLMVSAGKGSVTPSGKRSTQPEICSFSIPLITIVATFVFELFLPVVVLLFGLFFLLKLKFCIMPELSLAAGVTGEIALDGGVAAVEASIEAAVDASIAASFPGQPDIAAGLTNEYSPVAVANLEVAVVGAADPATGPSVSAGIEWEPEVSI